MTGGATGVDYYCMDECLKQGAINRLRVFIPAKLEHYINDYRKNWKLGPITDLEIDKLEAVLREIKNKNPAALLEFFYQEGDITQEIYNERHDAEVLYSDEVYAFQVNSSTGTQDTIDKAISSGLSIGLHKKYDIKEISKTNQ